MPEIKHTEFVEWARLREAARLHKFGQGPAPLDPVIRSFRFCNVCREDDRTTIWIKNHIRDPFEQATPEIQLQAIVLARLINLPSMLGDLLAEGGLTIEKGIDQARCLEVAACRRAAGDTLFSMAYRCAPGPVGHAGGKIGYVIDTALQVKKVPSMPHPSGKLFANALTAYTGIGNFIAGQIVADARLTRLLADANDTMTWAPFGPGALAGANHAIGVHMKAKMSEEDYLSIGRRQHEMLVDVIPPSTYHRLTLHDVASNVNCETSKFVKLRKGLGSARRYI